MGRWCGEYGKWNVGGWPTDEQGLSERTGWVVNNKNSKPAIEAIEEILTHRRQKAMMSGLKYLQRPFY